MALTKAQAQKFIVPWPVNSMSPPPTRLFFHRH